MRKILSSVLAIGAVSLVVIAATGAFFSDTETSTGNILQAGAIDLLIDNESYVIDYLDPDTDPEEANGSLVASAHTSWELRDLTVERFFDFEDLKPGDFGEDTISIHVNNNDAWMCAAARITEDADNDITEPENEDGDDGTDNDGELDEEVNFAFWVDDGDNVFESDEEIFLQGPVSALEGAGQIAIADSGNNILGLDGPVPGGEDFYIGKYWCYGDITESPADSNSNQTPAQRQLTGFDCSGVEVDNQSQTDSVVADLMFYAEQSRNNDQFSCSEWQPNWPEAEEELVGAALSSYEPPSDCDLTVGDTSGDADYETIEEALANASENDTICVEDDDYVPTEILELNLTGLTLASLTGPTDSATITGGIYVNADDVTVTGFVLDGYDLIESSENAAIYVNSAISGTTVSHNRILAPDGAKGDNAKGIVTEIGNSGTPGALGLSVMHNELDGWRQGIFYNTANHETAYNDFYNNDVGVANDGPHSSSIHHNDFEGNVLEAVGVAPSATNGTSNDGVLTVNFNNFAPGSSSGNDVNHYGSSNLGGADIDAENNWWDGDAETDRTNDETEVDTEPAAGSAYPEN